MEEHRNDRNRTDELFISLVTSRLSDLTHGNKRHGKHAPAVCQLIIDGVNVFTKDPKNPTERLCLKDRHWTVEHVVESFAVKVVGGKVGHETHCSSHGKGKDRRRDSEGGVHPFIN
jgi:hypothetical protein